MRMLSPRLLSLIFGLLLLSLLLLAACTPAPATPTPLMIGGPGSINTTLLTQSAAMPTGQGQGGSIVINEATPTPETLTDPLEGGTASAQTAGQSDEVGAVIVRYLEARVASDEPTLRELTCAAQEANLSIHVNSFKGQDASLRDVACTFDGANTVSCTGEIVLRYDGEEQVRAPGRFSVVQEDGVWRWCGEAR